RSFTELIELEHANRTVPNDRSRTREHASEALGRIGADVEDHFVRAYVGDGFDVGFRARRKLLGTNHISRQWDFDPELLGPREQSLCAIDHVCFDERLAHRVALRSEESIRNATADDPLVD